MTNPLIKTFELVEVGVIATVKPLTAELTAPDDRAIDEVSVFTV